MLSIRTMSKLSSKQMGDLVFPLVCEQCGASRVVPCADATMVAATYLMLAVSCDECGHREYIVATNCRVTLARRADRRGDEDRG